MLAGDIHDDRPIIRQASFYFKNERVYTFDVNQTITIHKLKRMIITAANLGKVALRIFSNNVEYTDKDNSSYEELFPNQQHVNFTFEASEPEEDNMISLRFKDYCKSHKKEAKYPYYYCYTCNKSICSLCTQSPEHRNHSTKEKYDYLQRSRILVENFFSKLSLSLLTGRDVNDNSLDQLLATISFNFSQLAKMIKQIEQSLIDLVIKFKGKKTKNLDQIKINITSLKELCSKGLDALKDGLNMKNLIIDENVFLTIDERLKNLAKEEIKFQKDIQSFDHFCEIYLPIDNQVNQVYLKLVDFLSEFLKDETSKILDNRIKEFDIEGVNRDEIHRMLSEIKPTRESNRKEYMEPTSFDKLLSRNENRLQYTGKLLQGTNKLLVYNSNTNKVRQIAIDFSLTNGLNFFLNNCAWVNHNNRLYFSGGLDNMVGSNTFFVYNLENNSLKRLPNMFFGHYNHSMIVQDNILYVVGGNSNQCEKCDLVNYSWSQMSSLIFEQQYPVLFPNKNFLYCFFGLDNNKHCISKIQRIDLKNEKAKWEILPYQRNDCSLDMFGCGILRKDNNDDVIYFVGGKDDSTIKRTTIEFNFSSSSFRKSSYSIDTPAYFKDSILPQFVDGTYKAFSLQDDLFLSLIFN